MPSIKQNLNQITRQIQSLCQKSQKNDATVQLLAVSKKQTIAAIEAAIAAGQNKFGENYAQEGLEKINYFSKIYPHIEWHFIGPIQSNKTRLIAQHFNWVHTVDRLKIAERLNAQRNDDQAALQVLIQVNSSEETSKSGCHKDDVLPLAKAIHGLPHLTLRGLMCIPKHETDPIKQRAAFAPVQALFTQLKAIYPEVDTLSMGMSGDMEAAIESGSTLVRIGTAIFGERD